MTFLPNSELPLPRSMPFPPRNAFAKYSFREENAIDLAWDNPGIDPMNIGFNITGVNVYRSFDSELGEFVRINDSPIQSGYYSDTMTHVLITEDVSNKFIFRGDGIRGEWAFKTDKIIVKDSRDYLYANSASDVEITIDGQPIPAAKVLGEKSLVYLPVNSYRDKLTRTLVDPIFPGENSVVLCTYRYNANFLNLARGQRVFYKVTSISDHGETSLLHTQPFSNMQIEAWDYIWREAVKRNQWIVDQGGEVCEVMVRKWVGERCDRDDCWSEFHNRSRTNCAICFGTGIVGGYEGPFPFIMAPVDAPEKLERSEKGLSNERTSSMWTTYRPLLKTFDLIFRSSGDIFIVGEVNSAEVRGNRFLQQTFDASLMSRSRIEYKILRGRESPEAFVTNRSDKIPQGEEVKGFTVTFENQQY